MTRSSIAGHTKISSVLDYTNLGPENIAHTDVATVMVSSAWQVFQTR